LIEAISKREDGKTITHQMIICGVAEVDIMMVMDANCKIDRTTSDTSKGKIALEDMGDKWITTEVILTMTILAESGDIPRVVQCSITLVDLEVVIGSNQQITSMEISISTEEIVLHGE
jgi:hypothetical protein